MSNYSRPTVKFDGDYDRILSNYQIVFVVLTSLFVTCLITADIVGVKLFAIHLPLSFMGLNTEIDHTCGMITFPFTFLITDLLNEYYGAKSTRLVVYIGLAMSIIVFGVINIAQYMPYLDKPFNVSKDSFDMIFGSAKLMYVASICAYLIGQLSDIWLFGVIKRITKGKLLWLRATGSTVISQFLDSFVVSYLAFSLARYMTDQKAATLSEVFQIAITGYTLKFFISISLTPVIYILRYLMSDILQFSPFPAESLTSPTVGTRTHSLSTVSVSTHSQVTDNATIQLEYESPIHSFISDENNSHYMHICNYDNEDEIKDSK